MSLAIIQLHVRRQVKRAQQRHAADGAGSFRQINFFSWWRPLFRFQTFGALPRPAADAERWARELNSSLPNQ